MRLFLLAGEPSGDRLGGALMAGLKELAPGTAFTGVGGPMMQGQGLASIFPMHELSVMGLAEVLPKYLHLRRRLHELAALIAADPPDALVTIDSPDFSLRLAALARKANPTLPVIHYVAPSVWAWRPGRAVKMAKVVDHVLALLPFEPPYMTAAGMTCDFVGHPVVSERLATAREADAFAGSHPLILALPGSRLSEVRRIAPVIGQTLTLLKVRFPGLRVVLPTVPHVAPTLRDLVREWPVRPEVIENADRKRAAFAAADVAIAASGTVSLELAANDCPMVIAYDMNPITFQLMKRMARIRTVTLVNLVSETSAVPEFLGPDCRAARIAPAVARLLTDPDAQEAQRTAMRRTMQRLGKGDEAPCLRAARSVLSFLETRQPSAPLAR